MGVKQNRIVGEDEDRSERGVRIDVRPVIARAGDTVEIATYIRGSGVRILVSATPADNHIRVLDVNPAIGAAPMQVRVKIMVSPDAKPGTYYIYMTASYRDRKRVLASAGIPVIVLSRSYDTQILRVLGRMVEDIAKLQKIYLEKGIQYALIYVLSMIKAALSFSHIKLIYELIAGHRLSNGTVGDLLKRLLRKGILRREGDLYHLNVDLDTAESIIDVERARNGIKGALRTSLREHRADYAEKRITEMPEPVEKALRKAEELLRKDYWLGVDFIAHTLLGIRKTGLWLLWHGDYFLYYEGKTGFLHYYISPWLSSLLKHLGLEQGLMTEHREHPSEKYILELYGSYANARRIHYILKQIGWLTYREPLLLEISEDYIAAKGLETGETLFKYGEQGGSETLRAIAYPGEHVDEENEETYFYRPANLY